MSATDLEPDIHALLALGVPLTKLEDLYGAHPARAAAQSFVVADSNSDGRLRVGTEVLRRSPSTKETALANTEFIESLMASLGEDPDEILMDPLMMAPLRDPVVLSTGFVVDRQTALDGRGRLRFTHCPFSRIVLKRSVYPLKLLRKMAVDWRLKQLERCLQLAEVFVEAGQWTNAEQVFRTSETFLDDLGDGTYRTKSGIRTHAVPLNRSSIPCHMLLSIGCLLLATCHLLLVACCLPLAACHLLLAACCLLLGACHLLLDA